MPPRIDVAERADEDHERGADEPCLERAHDAGCGPLALDDEGELSLRGVLSGDASRAAAGRAASRRPATPAPTSRSRRARAPRRHRSAFARGAARHSCANRRCRSPGGPRPRARSHRQRARSRVPRTATGGRWSLGRPGWLLCTLAANAQGDCTHQGADVGSAGPITPTAARTCLREHASCVAWGRAPSKRLRRARRPSPMLPSVRTEGRGSARGVTS